MASIRGPIIALLIALTTPALAQDAQSFFKDKQIRIIVGSAAGGGYDVNARAIARHYGKHIPGAPTFVVQTLVGAGSIALGNVMQGSTPRDGTVIGAPINGMPTSVLFTPEVTKYDPEKFLWIGSSNRETQVSYSWHASGITSLEDLKTKDYLAGATAPGTTQVDYPLVAAALFGLRYKVISGYKSTTDIHLAMERGEVQGIADWSWSSLKVQRPAWIKDGSVRILMQGALERDKELPDVPNALDFVKDGTDRKALELFFTQKTVARPLLTPPEVPMERVNTLRAAFMALDKDDLFKEEARKSSLDLSLLSGEAVDRVITLIANATPDVKERLAAAMKAQ